MLRIVKTNYGIIEGVPCGNPRITVFKGIPYASPPVGDLRFKAPQSPKKWDGILKADTFPPISLQNQPGENFSDFYTKELNPTAYEYTMSEDCLYINIWSPAKSIADRLPVLFYIHGGGFTSGYSYEVEFDGESVARNGIIFITVGYRLGALGFFAHKELEKESPGMSQGNFGLLDQIAAIKWVKENISEFGGDPDRITIAGQSAGGMSVGCHLNSPMAVDLFSGAIMMSSGGIRPPAGGVGPWRTLEQAQSDGAQLLSYLGVKTVEEARRLPANIIAKTGLGNWPGRSSPMIWRPTVDGVFLTEDSRDAVLNGHVHNVPIMIGCCKGESLPNPAFSPELSSLDAFVKASHARYGAKAVEFFSLCDISSEENFKKFAQQEISLGAFFTGAVCYARQLAELGRPVYSYLFDHDIPGDEAGSFHGSDMWFIFDSLTHCWRPFEGKHYDLARQVSAYWANFVKTGNPNGMDRNGADLPEWHAYTRDEPFIICFKEKPLKWQESNSKLNEFVQKSFLEKL